MATDRRRRSSARSRRRGVPHGFHVPGRPPAAVSSDAGDPARPWWEARRCPDPGTFGAFLEDSLPVAEYERVYEHIEACPVCHQVFAQIVVVLNRITKAKSSDEEQPPRPARRAKPRPAGPPALVDSPLPPVVPTPPEPVDREIEPQAVPTSVASRAPSARRALLAAGVALAVGLGLPARLEVADTRPSRVVDGKRATRASVASSVQRHHLVSGRGTAGPAHHGRCQPASGSGALSRRRRAAWADARGAQRPRAGGDRS